jgi:polyketide synthase PksN
MEQADYAVEIKDILQRVKDNKLTPLEAKRTIEEIKGKEGIPNQTISSVNKTKDVAVIGISGRFPGAGDMEEYWNNLKEGKSSIREVPKERWNIDDYFDKDMDRLDKTNSRFGGFLEGIDRFDPSFLGNSGMEEEVMDPQQRLFLEECFKTLEDGGYAGDMSSGLSCGVYVGAAPRDYLNYISEQGAEITAQTFWGNTGSVLASRISYLLNLKGPAMAIDTACSSSLVALHLACQSIVAGENDMALAGGVWISTTPHYYIFTSNAGMLSPEGLCKTFDNDANGIVNGEGVGAVLLKSYEQALKDGDYIYGIIKSSGINQDGKTNGITAPSSLSQTALELEVYQKGNINPESITYMEAHGTGTKLGDPIEIEALKNAFKGYTDKKQFCALGSVKTNIGHSSLAAGIASFLKVILALNNKKIPPSLNFKKENELLELSDSPFYVNTKLQEWTSQDGPLRAGVSSFGFGGTNAHLVVEEFTGIRRKGSTLPYYLAVFSARTRDELLKRIKEFLVWSKKQPDTFDLGDICYSLGNRRKHYHKRAAFVVSAQTELDKVLEEYIIQQLESEFHSKASEKENLKGSKVNNLLYEELEDKKLSADRWKELLLSLSAGYMKGEELQWNRLYAEKEYNKIPLPLYPFARNSYWVKEIKNTVKNGKLKGKIHPLIDENTSTLKEQKFLTELNTCKPFYKECFEGEKRYFPASNYLELISKTAELSAERKVRYIDNFCCAGSEVFNGKEYLLKTCIFPSEEIVPSEEIFTQGEACQAEITACNDEEDFVCAQAQVVFEVTEKSMKPENYGGYPTGKEIMECIHRDDFYKILYRECNRSYGNSYQVIKNIWIPAEGKEAFAELNAPDTTAILSEKLGMNTFILESAYQIGLYLIKEEKFNCCYFKGFDRLEILEALQLNCSVQMALADYEGDKEEVSSKYTVTFINPDGKAAIRIVNYNIISY